MGGEKRRVKRGKKLSKSQILSLNFFKTLHEFLHQIEEANLLWNLTSRGIRT